MQLSKMSVREFELNKKTVKMKPYKFIFLSIIVLLSFGTVTAQEETRNNQELSFYGKGLLNSLKYDIGEGADITRGAGGGLGIQYCLYMSKKMECFSGTRIRAISFESSFIGIYGSLSNIRYGGGRF